MFFHIRICPETALLICAVQSIPMLYCVPATVADEGAQPNRAGRGAQLSHEHEKDAQAKLVYSAVV